MMRNTTKALITMQQDILILETTTAYLAQDAAFLSTMTMAKTKRNM